MDIPDALSAPFLHPTIWGVCGLLGAACFAGRWAVQVQHRRRTGAGDMPRSFWWISLLGALLTLLYFTFGHPDAVGILQNLLPAGLSLYNLWLDRAAGKPT